jgi:cytochrome b involved in lipid metabolism
MTATGRCDGNDLFVCNLKEEYYEAFADYVVDIAETFIKAGYPIASIAPFNEADVFWNPEAMQEGCYTPANVILEIGKMIATKIIERNVPVKLAIPETGNFGLESAFMIYEGILADDVLYSVMYHFSGHTYTIALPYEEVRARFTKLEEKYGRKLDLYMSEWTSGGCDETISKKLIYDENSADLKNMLTQDMLITAREINKNLSVLNCVGWSNFMGFEHLSHPFNPLVYITENRRSDAGNVIIPKKYYGVMNFSKFLPGSTNILLEKQGEASNNIYSSAYYNYDTDTMYVILINNGVDDTLISLKGAGDCYAKAYQTSMRLNCEYIGVIDCMNGYIAPGESVTTLVIARGENINIPADNPENTINKIKTEAETKNGGLFIVAGIIISIIVAAVIIGIIAVIKIKIKKGVK